VLIVPVAVSRMAAEAMPRRLVAVRFVAKAERTTDLPVLFV